MKRLTLILLILFYLVAQARATEISWWKLDGNANDSVGPNNGTLVNSPTFTTGKANQGATFVQASDQYIDIATSNIISTDEWSVFAWIKPTSSATTRYVFISGDLIGAANSGMYMRLTSTQLLRCAVTYGTDVFFAYTEATTTLTADGNTWQHVGCIKRGTDIEAWIDKAASASGSTLGATDWTGDLGEIFTRIGQGPTPGSAQAFDGMIDEVHIYNHAIDQATIDALFDYVPAAAATLIVPVIVQ